MPHISRSSKLHILAFFAAVLAGLLLTQLPVFGASAACYGAILIVWAMTAQRRILQKSIRRDLVLGAMLLVLLFFLRVCRYELADLFPKAGRLLWYAYYIPFTATPLCSLCAALAVGRGEEKRPALAWLWAVCALLAAAAMTNDIHGLLLRFSADGRLSGYGPIYHIVVAWGSVLTLASFIVLIHRCRLSQSRRLWFVPLGAAAIGAALLIWYYAAGGSPTLFGRKLFHLHEAYAMPFILFWEACIQIGLIPSNTDYRELFLVSRLNAALLDRDGNIVLCAADYAAQTDDVDHIRRRNPIAGGYIEWTEDISAIHRLNEDIADAAETIEQENELIREENLILAENAQIAEQNRLYDKLAKNVRGQLLAIDAALTDPPDDEAAFCARLIRATVLGAYVKRRANLELLSDRASTLSSGELYYAVRESFEYLALAGVDCEARQTRERQLPARLVLAAYDLFEAVLEAAMPTLGAFYALLGAEDGFSVTLSLDDDTLPLDEDAWRDTLSPLGAALSVAREDDTAVIRLFMREEAEP